eukprot:CAMPEP_0197598142 /NCGR_PEP_ID=MMETSP1326-20131121/28740_1 /TAXON_ID=1155430 /ORGANISM="Genus nov. species nov., Strain RCC2288" /LENGTH=94 /DNA_ID=CAMNT_0043164905 /DNA_START=200 /DNA_END=480 /DNA_ORIENTATION=-
MMRPAVEPPGVIVVVVVIPPDPGVVLHACQPAEAAAAPAPQLVARPQQRAVHGSGGGGHGAHGGGGHGHHGAHDSGANGVALAVPPQRTRGDGG